MTHIGTHIAAVLAAGAVATGALFGADAVADGGLFDAGSDEGAAPAALVIDASLARDGRELVDSRLEDVDAEVRLPRDADEARTNVRYFVALDYRVYVAGSQATAAVESTGVDATPVDGLDGALDVAR
jgi:N-acetylmuramoyl-L-alanine amidase